MVLGLIGGLIAVSSVEASANVGSGGVYRSGYVGPLWAVAYRRAAVVRRGAVGYRSGAVGYRRGVVVRRGAVGYGTGGAVGYRGATIVRRGAVGYRGGAVGYRRGVVVRRGGMIRR